MSPRPPPSTSRTLPGAALALACGLSVSTAQAAGGHAPAGHAPAGHARPKAHGAAAGHVAAGPRQVRPDEALARLKEGNARFVRGRVKRPNAGADRRSAVAGGQNPFAVIVSCADSRVPPEILFDQGIGDLFVVRTAGQALGDFELASIEYAVEHLGTPFILVLGHERCGAIKATVEAVHPPPVTGGGHGDAHGAPAHGDAHGAPAHGDTHGAPAHGDTHGAPAHGDPHGDPHGDTHGDTHGDAHGGGHGAPARDFVDTAGVAPRDHIHLLVDALKPAVTAVDGKVPPTGLVDAAIAQNVRIGVARLVRESPLLKSFLVAGRIRIAGARYDLDTGEVRILRD
jgi:carbonic anhydrase